MQCYHCPEEATGISNGKQVCGECLKAYNVIASIAEIDTQNGYKCLRCEHFTWHHEETDPSIFGLCLAKDKACQSPDGEAIKHAIDCDIFDDKPVKNALDCDTEPLPFE